MKNKAILYFICVILVVGIVVSVITWGKKDIGSSYINKKQTINVDGKEFSYKIDADFYGDITIGESTMNMLSTYDMLKEFGMEINTLTASGYRDKTTKEKFNYNTSRGEKYYEVEFATHDSTYNDNGCRYGNVNLSSYIELPKNITYNSTISDVITAYGEPVENKACKDDSYKYTEDINGNDFGTFDATKLTYEYEQDNVSMKLYLYFAKNTEKLYRVEYNILVKNNA